MRKRYMLKNTRLVFLTLAERAEMAEAERLYKAEQDQCFYFYFKASAL